MDECKECYSYLNRATPLLKPEDCLKNHTQYICSSCGRCICIEKEPKRGLQRWHFPFKTLEIAKLYLRTADVTMQQSCGIYEIKDVKGRCFYKIFVNTEALKAYLIKNKGKVCPQMMPVYQKEKYIAYPRQQVRKLTLDEVSLYLNEIKIKKCDS